MNCAEKINRTNDLQFIHQVTIEIRFRLFRNILVRNILAGIPSECQAFWIQIRPDVLSGLIWVLTVCKGYQQMTLVGKELKSVKE